MVIPEQKHRYLEDLPREQRVAQESIASSVLSRVHGYQIRNFPLQFSGLVCPWNLESLGLNPAKFKVFFYKML